ncbi:MAG TPA: DUF2798 domain-containing protein, partial [Coprococcus sp.]|nr:DUF2798 domain-containing protein [Coprococcus sp.]
WQLCYCGPLVRLIFRTIFKRQLADSGCVEPSKEPQPES